MRALLAVVALWGSVAAAQQTGSGSAAGDPMVGGGNATLYVGTYAKNILVLDEATMKVRDTIKSSIGIPSIQLSSDRKYLYLRDPAAEQFEIIDIAAKKSLGVHTLSSGSTKVRIWGFNVDPKDRFAVLLVKSYTKRLDRYEVGPPTLLKYDIAKRAVTDTIPWPQGQERENAGIIFPPNGETMYFLTGQDVLVYDSNTLKQVDRWDLSRTLYEEGMGQIGLGFPFDIYEEPGFYTGLFRNSDPVNHRNVMGVARLDLVNRSVEFYPLGPSANVSFRLTPDKKRAYGLHSEVGNYEFWTFDLESHRVLGKTQFPGRPRMGLVVSSNGSQLYITTAGSTIDRYEAGTFRHLGTVNLGADMTNVVLIPRAR
jgi:DNA-binding beta-propeller fold protein YncE